MLLNKKIVLTSVILLSCFCAATSAGQSDLAKKNIQLTRDKSTGKAEVVATFWHAMPTGVTVTETGRIFVSFPRWGDDVPFTVAEINRGAVVPYPNSVINIADINNPGKSFLSVQSVVADGRGKLWVLDTASPGFSNPLLAELNLLQLT